MSLLRKFSICLSLIILVSSYAKAQERVRIVTFLWPPNMITDKLGAKPGQPKGAIVQVWENYIAPKAGIKIEWLGPYPFSRAMSMLESGEADAIQHLSKTPEREKKFIFSTKPIMRGRQGLVVLKNEKMNAITSVQQIKDKPIAMIGEGYLAPFYLQNKNQLKLVEVYGEEAGRQIVKMVLSGRVWGGYFTFSEVLMYYAASEKRLNDLKVISFPGSDSYETIYTAFSRKCDPALIRKIDTAITAVSETYDYPAMMRRISVEVNK